MKIYECKLCRQFVKSGIKGFSMFKGTRQSVRKHLVEVHGLKSVKNPFVKNWKSEITKNTIVEEWDE